MTQPNHTPEPSRIPHQHQPVETLQLGLNPDVEYTRTDVEWALERAKMDAVDNFMDGRASETDAKRTFDDAEQIQELLRRDERRALRGPVFSRVVRRLVGKAKD